VILSNFFSSDGPFPAVRYVSHTRARPVKRREKRMSLEPIAL
jgi:hypothetical protein